MGDCMCHEKGVGRRRLVVLIVLLVGVAAFWAWFEDERTLLLWEQAGKALNIGKKQTATDQEITRERYTTETIKNLPSPTNGCPCMPISEKSRTSIK